MTNPDISRAAELVAAGVEGDMEFVATLDVKSPDELVGILAGVVGIAAELARELWGDRAAQELRALFPGPFWDNYKN